MPLNAARDALISVQGQLIAVLAARNAELEARVAGLEERLVRLERAVSRNSSRPEDPQEIPAGRMHQPAHLLPSR